MISPRRFKSLALQITCAGLVAVGMLMPVAASAAQDPSASTGTLTGSVTCGSSGETAAGNALVAIEGTTILTHADTSGKFTLAAVPGGLTVTVDAMTGAFMTSRYNVPVQAGQTLDIGSLNLAVCALPALAVPSDDRPTELDQTESR